MKGKKRVLGVDSLGNLQEAEVCAANTADCACGERLVRGRRGDYPRLRAVLTDQGFDRGGLDRVVAAELGCPLDVLRRAPGRRGFAAEPVRWVVEQAIACLGRNRRLSRDYEYENDCSRAFLLLASISRSLKRLTAQPRDPEDKSWKPRPMHLI